MCNQIINTAAVTTLINNIVRCTGNTRHASISTIANIGNVNEQLSEIVIGSGAIDAIAMTLADPNTESYVKGMGAKALQKIGRHSWKQLQSICEKNCLLLIVKAYFQCKDEESKTICSEAIAALFKECKEVSFIVPILLDASTVDPIQTIILQALQTVLLDSKARRVFTELKALQFIQGVLQSKKSGKDAKEAIAQLNTLFPEEAVKFYTPNYDKSLMDAIVAKDSADRTANSPLPNKS